MSQNPTDVSVVESFVDYKGLQDKDDSLNRPKGVITNGINVYDSQASDCNRREGRDFLSLEANPILVIYQFTWDDNSFSVALNGNGTTTFTSHSTIPSSYPGPMPNTPGGQPLLFKDPYLPDFVSFIRAMSEAKFFALQDKNIGMRDQVYGLDFYDKQQIDKWKAAAIAALNAHQPVPPYPSPIASNVHDRKRALFYLRNHYIAIPNPDHPVSPPGDNMSIKDNFYWVDYYVDRNYVLADLNALVQIYNDLSHNFVKTSPIEDSATIDNYDSSDDYVPPNYSFKKKPLDSFWKTIARELEKRINENLLVVNSGSFYDVDYLTRAATNSGVGSSAARSCVVSKISSVPWGTITSGINLYTYNGCSLTSVGSAVNAFNWAQSSGPDIHGIWFASIQMAKSRYFFDLTRYPEGGSVDVYLMLVIDGVARVTTESWILPVSSHLNTYGKFSNQNLKTGESGWTGYAGDFPGPSYWVESSGYQILDAVAVITRAEPKYKAQLPGGLYNLILFPTTEMFKNTLLGSITNVESDIQWNSIKLNLSGAADRSVYTTESPAPFSGIHFSSSAPGFKKPNNASIYKPSIFANFSISGVTSSGSPTRILVRLYINDTLVRTSSIPISSSAFNQTIPYCFSVLNVGNFGFFRPPDNNKADSNNGWESPVVRITCQTDTGEVYMNKVSLNDVVINYPI